MMEGDSGGDPMFDIPDPSDLELCCPDLVRHHHQVQERTISAMEAFDPGLLKRTLPNICRRLSIEELSAICIQKHYRGYQGRKRYLAALLHNFEKEERLRREKTLLQLEEGELLIKNHKLEVEFEDNHCLRRNQEQRRLSKVLTIQRAWRKYKRLQSRHRSCDHNHYGNHSNQTFEYDLLAEDVNGNPLRGTVATVAIETQGANTQPLIALQIGGVMSKSVNSKSPVYAVSDLGSDLEVDHLTFSTDHSPITPSDGTGEPNCNRLSLAEEFATMEQRLINGEEKGLVSEEEDDESDYYGGSSEVTTPEWDRPEISLRRGATSPSSQAYSPIGDGLRTMVIDDPNRNPSKSSGDLNANHRMSEVAGGCPGGCKTAGCLSSNSTLQQRHRTAEENRNRDDSHNTPTNHASSLDKRKAEVSDPGPGARTKVSCEGPMVRDGSDTTLSSYLSDTEQSSQLMDLSNSSSSSAANPAKMAYTADDESPTSSTNFPRVAVPKVEETCPTCEGVQGPVPPAPLDGEVTVPVLDWESLERHLAKMEIEEEKKKKEQQSSSAAQEEVVQPVQPSPRQIQKNSRLAILRKLAMGEDDIEGDIYGKGRDKFSSRLQSGMNLQICFVNDSVDGSDAEEEPSTAVPRVANRDSRFLFSRESSVGSPSTGTSPKTPSVTFEDLEDFESKQARLQAETRIALAQVKEVVKLQMELDRQQRKKSPTTELAGVSGLSDISEGLSNNHFDQDLLQSMTVSKLQFIANELHSKIERLNEELVQLLMTRDELQHGQDSQLVDIEDLTRWIRMNMHQTNNNTLLSSHEPISGNPRRKQAEQTLLKLLGRSLPASGRKCICGVSRSSSVVSNRSVSSPEPDPCSKNPLSPTSPQSCRSESSIGESHTPSPELTWVRQTFVRYWYN